MRYAFQPLILLVLLAPLAASPATSESLIAEPHLGRAVAAEIARPDSGSGLAPHIAEVGIGRERSEEHFRALKRPRTENVKLGGRERFDDLNLRIEPQAAQVVASFASLPQYYSVPYDAAIATSGSQVLVMTNNEFAVYDKLSGIKQSSGLYINFFGTAAGGGYDPKCYYDAAAGRFVMVVLEWATNPNRAQVDIAVSQTSDANGAWSKYIYDATLTGSTATGTWSDYPGLGFDDKNVYLATNQFSFSGAFQFSKLRVWSKAELYSGTRASYIDFAGIRNADGSNAFAIKPARTLSPSTTGRFLATRPSGGSSVSIWTITGTFPNVTLSAARTVSIGSYSVGPDAQQPGSSVRIDTGDCRTQDVVWRSGHYHTAFTEKKGNGNKAVTAVRYLDVTDAGSVTRDVTYAASGIWLYYPAVSTDAAGNVAMAFERSSGSEHVSLYQTRMPSGGSFESSQRLTAGVAPNTRGRWGDYNGVANDPSDSSRVWLYGGYGVTNNRWATWIASVKPSVAGSAPAMVALSSEPGEEEVRSASTAAGADSRLEVTRLAPGARLSFELRARSIVRLGLFDVSGRRVRALVDGVLDTGRHVLDWDGRDDGGRALSTGVYWARFDSGSGIQVKRLMLSK